MARGRGLGIRQKDLAFLAPVVRSFVAAGRCLNHSESESSHLPDRDCDSFQVKGHE